MNQGTGDARGRLRFGQVLCALALPLLAGCTFQFTHTKPGYPPTEKPNQHEQADTQYESCMLQNDVDAEKGVGVAAGSGAGVLEGGGEGSGGPSLAADVESVEALDKMGVAMGAGGGDGKGDSSSVGAGDGDGGESRRAVVTVAIDVWDRESPGDEPGEVIEYDEDSPSLNPAQEGDSRTRAADNWTDEQISMLLDTNPAALGCMSLGTTNSGAIFNSVQMPADEKWMVLRPDKAWGTSETIEYIKAAINKVHNQFPSTCPITIGNLSTPTGGRLGSHLSHQAGRDVDLGWYHKGSDCTWYRHATADNLDLERTWALVRALVTETDLKMMFIDRSVQILLHSYARGIGEDVDWLNSVFEYPARNGNALIRHAKGHRSHIHARFYNPEAQETGRRAYKAMVEKKMIEPPTYYVYHKVKSGQTLGHMAARYHVSVKAIQKANGMKSTMIRAGYRYRIPKKGGVGPVNPIVIPPRLLPPAPGQQHPTVDPTTRIPTV